MAYSLVQQKHNSANSGSTASVTGLTATTSGNLLVMLVSASKNPGDVTFTPPTGWVQAGTTVHNDVFISISTAIYYYANNPGGITSVSTTLSSTVSAWHMDILEYSGVTTTSPLDVTAMIERDHTTTPSSGNVTTTVDGDLLIGWMEVDDNNGAYTFTEASGWTSLTNFQDTDAWSTTYPAWKTAGTAGVNAYQPTKSNSVTDCTVAIVAFKPASGGGGPVQGAATLSAGLSTAEAGVVSLIGASGLAGSLSLAPTAAMSYVGAAVLSGSLNLSPSAVLSLVGSAPLSGSLTLTPAAVLALVGSTSLAGAALFSSAGVVLYAGSAALAGELDLFAAVSGGSVVGSAALGAALALSPQGVLSLTGAAPLSAGLSLSPGGVLLIGGSSNLAGAFTVDAQGVLRLAGAATLAAALTLFATQPPVAGQGIQVLLLFRDGHQALLFRDGSLRLYVADGKGPPQEMYPNPG